MSKLRDTYLATTSGERRGPLAALARAALLGASGPYAAVMASRNRLYDAGILRRVRVPVPVIVVGNLSTGGTGKTPCVEAIARFYRERDVRVAIVSRGYGSETGNNDEAMVLEENLPDVPHLQGADRVAQALTAVQELESELLILDDGFQHRRLHRDLDIVLLDATQPYFEQHLLPRGPLREPARQLHRAGVVVLTRCDQATVESVSEQRCRLARLVPDGIAVEAVHVAIELIGSDGRTAALDTVRGQSVFAFCGLGNPAAFRRTLADLGANVVEFVTFPDHHGYTREDVAALARRAGQLPSGGLALTTQKDFVKLRAAELGGRPLWAVRVGLRFREGEDRLHGLLARFLPERGGDE